MVGNDSNTIFVAPMKSRKDAKMIQAYNALLLWLKRAGIVPKKHVLNNEVSKNMKNHIWDTCKFDMELERIKDGIYKQFVCTVRPEKAESNQMGFPVGGERINYPSEVATPTAETLVDKILFISVISMKGAPFMTMDISNFYLMKPLHCPEFIWIKLSNIPNEVVKEYKLKEKALIDSSIYIRAKRGM